MKKYMFIFKSGYVHEEVVKVFFQPISALMFQRLAKHSKPEFYKKFLNW